MVNQRRTQRERVAESSRRLLESAIELIAEQGFERTTLAQISERAGYSKPMANVRYGSKEALLDVILRTEFEDRINAAPPDGTFGLDRVLARIDQVGRLAEEDANALRAMFVLCFEAVGPVSELRPHMIDWLARLRADLLDAVRDGRRDGSVRAGPDADGVVDQLVHTGIGLVYRWVLSPDTTDLQALLATWRAHTRDALH